MSSERLVQNLHAAISRRDWSAVEAAANAIRDDEQSARRILAGTDIGSLPNDWTTAQIAEARMNEINTLHAGIKRLSDEEELINETGRDGMLSAVHIGARLAESEQEAIVLRADRENLHTRVRELRETIIALMAKLADLLDEDHFAACEEIARSGGVEHPESRP